MKQLARLVFDMAIQRFFYVTQDSLIVWSSVDKALLEEVGFENSDAGFQLFSTYLEKSPIMRSLMVVDVIEEEFDTDSLPKVSGGDRKSLIERRLSKRFSRTPFRNGVFLGGRRRRSDDFNVVYSAITNHELVEPWLDIISQHKSPLVGLTSVPLISMDLLRRFHKPAENTIFLTEHQGGRLRLVFAKSGRPISARLSRELQSDKEEFGQSVVSEIVQSRKFLERSRLLASDDELHIYIIADEDRTKKLFSDDDRNNFNIHNILPGVAAKEVGLQTAPRLVNMEALYLAHCQRKFPTNRYELTDRTNYSQLLCFRHAIIGTAIAGAVACSIAAGVLISGAFMYRDTTQKIESQIAQMEAIYRRENEEFQPIRADSHEMKLAVDTGDFILHNTLPVDWVMGQIGLVMGDHTDMRLSNLSWEIESVADPNSANAARRNERDRPVPIPAIAAVTAKLSGQIHSYDGNIRHAFEKIDRLASSLQEHTAFEHVAVTEYPINASSNAALTGEIRRAGDNAVANFSLNMTLRVADETS